MRKKIVMVVICCIFILALTGCGSSSSDSKSSSSSSSNSAVKKAVKSFVSCQYKADLKCIVTSINYSGVYAYKKSSASLDNFWDEYKKLEEKNTNEIVLENAKENYYLAERLYHEYVAKVTDIKVEKLTKDVYKVTTTINLQNKDSNWDANTTYIVMKVDGKYSIIDISADNNGADLSFDMTVEKMVKDLKYADGTFIS